MTRKRPINDDYACQVNYLTGVFFFVIVLFVRKRNEQHLEQKVSDDFVVRFAVLLDYYGVLLSEQGARLMNLYYNEDLSLAEVSAMEGLSRQAVSSQLQKQRRLLEGFEARLGLVQKDIAQDTLFAEVLAHLEAGRIDDVNRMIRAMRKSLVEE